MKKVTFSLLAVALAIFIILAALPIPASALLKFYLTRYGDEVILSSCKKGDEKIYTVASHVFMSSTYYYYTSWGKKLGTYTETDAIELDDPGPPVNISEYRCIELKKRS